MRHDTDDAVETRLREAFADAHDVDTAALLARAHGRGARMRRAAHVRYGVGAVAVAALGATAVLLPTTGADRRPVDPAETTTAADPTPDTEPTTPTTVAESDDPSLNVRFPFVWWAGDLPANSLVNALSGADAFDSEEGWDVSQAAMAACMAEAGFAYAPQPFQRGEPGPDDEGRIEGSIAWAQEWGYGLVATPPSHDPASLTEADRQNEETYRSLSDADQRRYDVAFYGPAYVGDPSSGVGDRGCQGDGQARVAPDYDAFAAFAITGQPGEILRELLDARGDLSGPALGELNASWATCMADAGQPVDELWMPEAGMRSRYQVAAGLVPPDPDADERRLADDAMSGLTSTGREELVAEHPDLAALGEDEIALATVDMTCRAEVDYGARYRQLDAASQQDFIDTHREEIDKAIAAFHELVERSAGEG
jgi:hypothetical protein